MNTLDLPPVERLLLATFRKLPTREQIRLLRQAKSAAIKPKQFARS